MKNPYTQEIFVAIIFGIILLLLLNPLGLFMPDRLVYIMLGGIVVLFGLYVSFIMKESPQDERERLHRFVANRFAYLLGTGVLVVGIVYQGLTEIHIDPWLLIVLGVMVVGKISSLIHSEKNK